MAQSVGELAEDWVVRRQRLVDSLATLEAYTAAVVQAFRDVDATVVTVAVTRG